MKIRQPCEERARAARRRRAARRSATIAAALALLLPRALPAQDAGNASNPRRVLIPPTLIDSAADDPAKAAIFAGHLVASLGNELEAQGFSIDKPTDGPYDLRIARMTGYRWLAESRLSLEGGEASVSIAVSDSERHVVVAAEEFAAWGGPTLVTLIDAASRRIALALRDARDRADSIQHAPLENPSVFLSPDEGARVTIGTNSTEARKSGSFAANVVKGRALVGPLPIPKGTRVLVTVTKAGKLPYVAERLLEDGQPTSLPALADDPLFGLVVGLSRGRLPGIRLGAELHIPGGWFFMPLDDYLSFSLPDGPNAVAMLRDEIWAGAGAYLFFGPVSTFRMGAMAKGGIILVKPLDAASPLALDPVVEPIDLFAEYALTSRLALRFEIGAAYAFGVGPLSVLSTGWMGNLQPTLELAAEWKP